MKNLFIMVFHIMGFLFFSELKSFYKFKFEKKIATHLIFFLNIVIFQIITAIYDINLF